LQHIESSGRGWNIDRLALVWHAGFSSALRPSSLCHIQLRHCKFVFLQKVRRWALERDIKVLKNKWFSLDASVRNESQGSTLLLLLLADDGTPNSFIRRLVSWLRRGDHFAAPVPECWFDAEGDALADLDLRFYRFKLSHKDNYLFPILDDDGTPDWQQKWPANRISSSVSHMISSSGADPEKTSMVSLRKSVVQAVSQRKREGNVQGITVWSNVHDNMFQGAMGWEEGSAQSMISGHYQSRSTMSRQTILESANLDCRRHHRIFCDQPPSDWRGSL
jgi:hypothetical protein